MDRNKNSLFILPIYRRTENFYGKQFENIYISRNKKNEVKLVFNQMPSDEVIKHLQELKEFISIEEKNNKAVFTLQIPGDLVQDVSKYRRGKYSKFSKKFKNIILALNPEYNADLGIILFPKQADRDNLANRLDARIPEGSEVFDIIDSNEYYSEETIRP